MDQFPTLPIKFAIAFLLKKIPIFELFFKYLFKEKNQSKDKIIKGLLYFIEKEINLHFIFLIEKEYDKFISY